MPTITLPALDTTFDCASDDTILRAALRAGLGMAYECNVGSCSNCRFELLEGEVRHERENPPGWTERDKARNRYLGCQARPIGDCSIKVPLRPEYKNRFPPVRTRGTLYATEDLTHDIREFRFRLDTPTPFLPGQYTLVAAPDVEGIRAYSMSNITVAGEERHFQIRRVPGGRMTGFLFDGLKVGQSISIDGPYGLAYLREDSPRDILCLGGGSGIAPMISIARAVAVHPQMQDRTLHFIYGGRTPRDLCGEPILKDLPGYGSRIFYHSAISETESEHARDWTGRKGFVHEVALELFGPKLPEFEIYFAGPPLMADAIMKMAITSKVPAAQLHFDKFY